MISHRPYRTLTDFEETLSLELRPEDKVELIGKGFTDVPTAILESIEYSTETSVILIRGYGIAGVFGVAKVGGAVAVPWMLAERHIEDQARSFARQSKKVVEGWTERYGELRQEVWEGHASALRWLEWLGFERLSQDVCYDGMINYQSLIKEAP